MSLTYTTHDSGHVGSDIYAHMLGQILENHARYLS
jgi:hypothetical protein